MHLLQCVLELCMDHILEYAVYGVSIWNVVCQTTPIHSLLVERTVVAYAYYAFVWQILGQNVMEQLLVISVREGMDKLLSWSSFLLLICRSCDHDSKWNLIGRSWLKPKTNFKWWKSNGRMCSSVVTVLDDMQIWIPLFILRKIVAEGVHQCTMNNFNLSTGLRMEGHKELNLETK